MSVMQEMIDNVKKLVKEKKFPEAVVEAENVLSYNVKDYNLYMFTANAYLETKSYEKCYKILIKAIDLKPENRTAYAGILKLYTEGHIKGSDMVVKSIKVLISLDSKDSTKIENYQKTLKKLYMELNDFDSIKELLKNDNSMLADLLDKPVINNLSKDLFEICFKNAVKNREIKLPISIWLNVWQKLYDTKLEMDPQDYLVFLYKFFGEKNVSDIEISYVLACNLLLEIISGWYELGYIDKEKLHIVDTYKIKSTIEDGEIFIAFKKSIELLKLLIKDDSYASHSMTAQIYIPISKSYHAYIAPFSTALLTLFCLTHNYYAASPFISEIFSKGRHYPDIDNNRIFSMYYSTLLEIKWFFGKIIDFPIYRNYGNCLKGKYYLNLFAANPENKIKLSENDLTRGLEIFYKRYPGTKDVVDYVNGKGKLEIILKSQSLFTVSSVIPYLCKNGFDVPSGELNIVLKSLSVLHDKNKNEPYVLYCITMLLKKKHPREAWKYMSQLYPRLCFMRSFTSEMLKLGKVLNIPNKDLLYVMDAYCKYGPIDHKFMLEYSRTLLLDKQYKKLVNKFSTYAHEDFNYESIKGEITLTEFHQMLITLSYSYREMGLYKKGISVIKSLRNSEPNIFRKYCILTILCLISDKNFLEAVTFYKSLNLPKQGHDKVYSLALYAYYELLSGSAPFSNQKLLFLNEISDLLACDIGGSNNAFKLILPIARRSFCLELAILDKSLINEVVLPEFFTSSEDVQFQAANIAFNETLSVISENSDKPIEFCHIREVVRCLLIKYKLENIPNYLDIALECLDSMEKKVSEGMSFELIICRSIILIMKNKFEEAKDLLNMATQIEKKSLSTWFLLFVTEILSDNINNENMISIVKNCITINNNDPLVPIMVVIAALNRSDNSRYYECESWEYLFKQVIQSAIRGQSLTVLEVFAFFKLLKPNKTKSIIENSESEDCWFAFKSITGRKNISYRNNTKEIGILLRSFAAQELNDISTAEEIIGKVNESGNELLRTISGLISGIKILKNGGSKEDVLAKLKEAPLIHNVEKAFESLGSIENVSVEGIKTLIQAIDNDDAELFKKAFSPKYVSLILAYVYSKDIKISKKLTEIMKTFPTNNLMKCNPYDNLEIRELIGLNRTRKEKELNPVTESEGDKVLLEKSLYLKLMYLKERYQ
uniref:TPR_REGION domain-containing protein n=1 Tax=Parastrongyloides trichosuri TaxID=131310 RepID=A0A0N4Z0K0_PARTI